MTKHYNAPWSNSLVMASLLVTALCAGGATAILLCAPGALPWTSLLPLAILAGAALFTIRGYTVTTDTILVHRLGWATRLPLAGLQSVRIEPRAMQHSLRLFGNGGLYSFSGLFRNKTLGVYRAFVTDPDGTVVLGYAGRTVVISPSPAEDFIRDLARSIPETF